MKGKVIPQWQPEQLNVTPTNRATWRSQVETERAPATSFLPGPGIASLRTSPEDLGTASPAPPNLTQQTPTPSWGEGVAERKQLPKRFGSHVLLLWKKFSEELTI